VILLSLFETNNGQTISRWEQRSSMPPDRHEVTDIALVVFANAVCVLRVEMSDSLEALWTGFSQRVPLHVAFRVIWHLLARMAQMLHVCLWGRAEGWPTSRRFFGSGELETYQIALWRGPQQLRHAKRPLRSHRRVHGAEKRVVIKAISCHGTEESPVLRWSKLLASAQMSLGTH